MRLAAGFLALALALPAVADAGDDAASLLDRLMHGGAPAKKHCEEPVPSYAGFAKLAASLGATVVDGHCRYSISALADLVRSEKPPVDHQGDWACVMLEDNLDRDIPRGCQPTAEDVLLNHSKVHRRVKGRLAYVGIWQSKYRYRVGPLRDGRTGVVVRVAFEGPLAQDQKIVAEMKSRLEEAARFWSDNSPGQKIQFHFEIVPSGLIADIVVPLTAADSRGPYYSEWSTTWDWHTIAHEVGHIMGLDDEYNQLKNTFELGSEGMDRDQCDPTSLMCNTWNHGARPKLYHYYLLLRRQLCPELGDEFQRAL